VYHVCEFTDRELFANRPLSFVGMPIRFQRLPPVLL